MKSREVEGREMEMTTSPNDRGRERSKWRGKLEFFLLIEIYKIMIFYVFFFFFFFTL